MDVRIEPAKELSATQRYWSEMEQHCELSPFQTWSWVGLWAGRALKDYELWQITVHDGAGLSGLALVTRRKILARRLFPVDTLYLHEAGPRALDFCIERNGLLLRRGTEESTCIALLEALNRSALPWEEIQIRRARIDDPILQLAEEKRIPEGLQVTHDDATVCRFVDLDEIAGSGVSYMDALSRSRRKKLRRELRILESAGPASVEQARDVPTGLQFLDELKELHQRRMQRKGERGAFADPEFERFHQKLIAAEIDRGGVQLLKISAGPTAIGFIYSLVHNRGVYVIQTGFDYDAISNLRPGEAAHYLAIDWNLAQGYRAYDFLGGDSFYKQTLSNRYDVLTNITIQKPKLKFRTEMLAKKCIRTIRQARQTKESAREKA